MRQNLLIIYILFIFEAGKMDAVYKCTLTEWIYAA
jgi:hypothetical protein